MLNRESRFLVFYGAIDLPAFDPDGDRLARSYGVGVANHRSVGRERHGISACKDAQGAETLEPRRGTAESRIGRVPASGDGRCQPAIDGHEPRANATEPAAQIERVKVAPQRLPATIVRRESRRSSALNR